MIDYSNLRALVAILFLAGIAFYVARPLALKFMRPQTFARRCRVWFGLTIVAFISPTFWIYAGFAIGILWWAQKQDENPLGLYALTLFVIPNVNFFLPTVVIGQLFDLTQYRILSLVVLVPCIARTAHANRALGRKTLEPLDLILIAFLSLQLALGFPYETFTTTMRRAFLMAIDTFVIFYAFSRLTTRERIADTMMCFFVAGLIMALVAMVENFKGWLLYTGLSSAWGNPNIFAWLLRGDRLRAQASAEHSINLGYQLSVGLGFLLYLQGRLPRPLTNPALAIAFVAGLIATGARGPWVTAITVWATFSVFRPKALRNLGGAAAAAALMLGVMYFTPLRESVIDRLPFIGTADQDTVIYRQQLAELSWTLILQNPLFGDPFVTLKMESMRQGQGIIDIVNGYIFTLLFTGFVGLGLVVSVFLGSLYKGLRTVVVTRNTDVEAAKLAASLVACMVASLVYTATAGYGPTTYLIAGLLVSAAHVLVSSRRSTAMGGAINGRSVGTLAPSRG